MKIKRAGAEQTPLAGEHFLRQKVQGDGGKLSRYMHLVVGSNSLLKLLHYELVTTLFGPIPGALGIFLRNIFFRSLFGKIGSGVTFGRSLTVRNAHLMRIGNNVVLDDYALLDARGAERGEFLIEDDVFIGRAANIHSKVGPLRIGSKSSIGAGTSVISQGGTDIGQDVSIGGGCKISGGLFKATDLDEGSDFFERFSTGMVRIENKVLIGMGCNVTDGVTIGERAIVGSGVTVSIDVPPRARVSARPPLVMKDKVAPRDEPEI